MLIVMGMISSSVEDASWNDTYNERAVREVLSGKRKVANAAWWGFHPEDATECLQNAIDSGAETVLIPYVGRPWIIRPIRLRSHLKLLFEPGVVVLAKRGEFRGRGDSLFRAVNATDITLIGYGATLRMWKRDYQKPPYEKAEWRMGLSFVGCRRIHVEGLRIESTGGDGIYIGATGENHWCEDVVIRNVTCYDNHRQGISVISAQNLLIENCVLAGTWGTGPSAGIDLEPNGPDERLVNCVIRNCVMENNAGPGILIYLAGLSRRSQPVSILFENCLVRMRESADKAALPGGGGLVIGAIKEDGPEGEIEFRNCVVEDTGQAGVSIFDKSPESARLRFVNCSWKNPWRSEVEKREPFHAPILLHVRRVNLSRMIGGIEFVDCAVYDTVDRPVLVVRQGEESLGVRDIRGQIVVHNPHGVRMDLGSQTQNVTLQLLTPDHR
jgi:hypothetical protein